MSIIKFKIINFMIIFTYKIIIHFDFLFLQKNIILN